MNVHIKIFPVYGLTEKSCEFDLQAEENATIKDVLHIAEETIGKKIPDKGIMLLHNGKLADLKNTGSICLKPDDWLWVMPVISGG